MYYVIVSTLMVVFPAASVLIENQLHAGVVLPALIAKWYVFWAMGVRLLLAGLRQIAQPRYTAQHILGIAGDDVLLVVRELGFGNVALSSIAIASLFAPSWVWAAALAGCVFYALAGVNHALQRTRTKVQHVAMITDLLAAVVLGYACCYGLQLI